MLHLILRAGCYILSKDDNKIKVDGLYLKSNNPNSVPYDQFGHSKFDYRFSSCPSAYSVSPYSGYFKTLLEQYSFDLTDDDIKCIASKFGE